MLEATMTSYWCDGYILDSSDKDHIQEFKDKVAKDGPPARVMVDVSLPVTKKAV